MRDNIVIITGITASGKSELCDNYELKNHGSTINAQNCYFKGKKQNKWG
jgi:uridine kinase